MNHQVSMVPNSPEGDEYKLQKFQATLIQTLMSNNEIDDPLLNCYRTKGGSMQG